MRLELQGEGRMKEEDRRLDCSSISNSPIPVDYRIHPSAVLQISRYHCTALSYPDPQMKKMYSQRIVSIDKEDTYYNRDR